MVPNKCVYLQTSALILPNQAELIFSYECTGTMFKIDIEFELNLSLRIFGAFEWIRKQNNHSDQIKDST